MFSVLMSSSQMLNEKCNKVSLKYFSNVVISTHWGHPYTHSHQFKIDKHWLDVVNFITVLSPQRKPSHRGHNHKDIFDILFWVQEINSQKGLGTRVLSCVWWRFKVTISLVAHNWLCPVHSTVWSQACWLVCSWSGLAGRGSGSVVTDATYDNSTRECRSFVKNLWTFIFNNLF